MTFCCARRTCTRSLSQSFRTFTRTRGIGIGILCGLALIAPGRLWALNLRVADPGREAIEAPAYRGDRIEIRLRPEAARAARAVLGARGITQKLRVPRLGLAGVDRVAASLGGATFEPEFRGETPPPEGSKAIDFTAFYIVHLAARVDLSLALAGFAALAEVASADPIAVVPVAAIPNDSLWDASTWFYQPATRRDIHAPEAWDITTGDSSIVVAVLDTGVLPYHPDLGGSVPGWPGQIWTDRAEADGLPGVDDDQNGFIDDVHGWDFVNLFTGDGVQSGEDWQNEDNDPNDFAGHGTAVAGVVGALSNNVIGVTGTAWNVRIMPLRIGWSTDRDPLGLVDMSFVAQAIRYATRMHVSVINCSFSTVLESGLDAAATDAIRSGVTLVVAAGNGGQPHELAERDPVVAVAYTDANDVVSPSSNIGPFVDLAAPGESILSTFIEHLGPDSISARQPAYEAGLSGTSLATPMVSGTVALMQALRRSRGLRPLEPMGVLLRLRETADDIAALNPGVTGYGTGRLNAFRALADPPTSTVIRGGAFTVGPAVALRTAAGRAEAAFVTSDAKLLIVSGRNDTLRVVGLPAQPISGLAAADMGGGNGIGVFATLAGGMVAGMNAVGDRLPGWPVSTHDPQVALSGEPALGDLDGDGALEVVAGAEDGTIWAWHADGSLVANFPLATDSSPISGSVALSNLDGAPGVEIVASTAAGKAYAFHGDGTNLTRWPRVVATTPLAPVIAKLDPDSLPTVVVAGGTRLYGFRPNGTTRFNTDLGGIAAQGLASADLDGDGIDEIIAATASPSQITVLDSTGSAIAAKNWPLSFAVGAAGPPVVAQVEGDPQVDPEILVMEGNDLIALTDRAGAIPSFPKPGHAGAFPTVVEYDVNGSSMVLAGSGPDSLLYFYDAGPGSHGGRASSWFTPRGNFARTGSTLYAPPLPEVDTSAPSAVADLAARFVGTTRVQVGWTASADDRPPGHATTYLLRAALTPIDESSFDTAPLRYTVPGLAMAGSPEEFTFNGLERGRRYWFRLKARDLAGNFSPLSDLLSVVTKGGGPLDGRVGPAIAPGSRPSRRTVQLYWQGTGFPQPGRQAIRIYDLSGRRLREFFLGNEPLGVTTWDGRDDQGNLVPAGLYFARLTSGSLHVQTRVVLLP